VAYGAAARALTGRCYKAADVAIVGGGPAGAAAAIECASAGLTTVLIERASFPRDRPGESLPPGIEPLFDHIGVSDAVRSAGFLRYQERVVDWDGAPRRVDLGHDRSGPWRGYQAWRASLDDLLLRRAREVGTTTIQPARAVAPLRDVDGDRTRRVCGVYVDHSAVRAQVLVDAAGGRHWLARHLGIPVIAVSRPFVAWYGYAQAEESHRSRYATDREMGEAPVLTADDDGWTWTALVRPALYQWTRLALTGKPLPHGWMPPSLAACRSVGKSRGVDVTWRITAAPAGRGYFMVGDAAYVVDPACSHGVLTALLSGIAAGQSIIDVASGRQAEVDAIAGYVSGVRRGFERDTAGLRTFYARFPGGAGVTSSPGVAAPPTQRLRGLE
jgi:flavin-dependent dehydrogenase